MVLSLSSGERMLLRGGLQPVNKTARDLALVGTIKWSGPLFTSSLISLLIGLTGWRVFHQLEPRMAERV